MEDASQENELSSTEVHGSATYHFSAEINTPCSETAITPAAVPEQLHKVFADFNRVATALDESYQALEQRVHSLKRDLSEARLTQQYDQAEKDRLANRLASLVSVLPCAVLVLNRQGLIIDRNPLASNALNEPLIGLSWEQVMERERVSECSPHHEIRLRDGRIFSVAKDGLAVSSDSAIFLTDVTDIHRAQSEMARNKRLTAMGEMASSMAHQIRTPLSSAHLYMSPLTRADLQPQERANIVAKIQERLSHIGTLVDSMLGFVRGTRASMDVLELNEVLDKVVNLVAAETQKLGATLHVSSSRAPQLIQADTQALVDALANLVLNAYQVSDKAPEVFISGSLRENKQIEIRVRDCGPGIALEKLERIFDPFYTTRSTGTGLGLAITAMTCEQHGGSICAANCDQGGAEFIVRLPVYEPKASCPDTAAAEIRPNKKIQREVA